MSFLGIICTPPFELPRLPHQKLSRLSTQVLNKITRVHQSPLRGVDGRGPEIGQV